MLGSRGSSLKGITSTHNGVFQYLIDQMSDQVKKQTKQRTDLDFASTTIYISDDAETSEKQMIAGLVQNSHNRKK